MVAARHDEGRASRDRGVLDDVIINRRAGDISAGRNGRGAGVGNGQADHRIDRRRRDRDQRHGRRADILGNKRGERACHDKIPFAVILQPMRLFYQRTIQDWRGGACPAVPIQQLSGPALRPHQSSQDATLR